MTLAKVESKDDWILWETCDKEGGVREDKPFELKGCNDLVGDTTIRSRSTVKVRNNDVCRKFLSVERKLFDERKVDEGMCRSEVDER